MPWYAQPSGGYYYDSVEGNANILMMNGFMNQNNYEMAAQAALIACCYHEGGLNPWRWGLDVPPGSVELQGYGLFQYTEWYKYVGSPDAVNLPGYGPNMSITTITPGARPEDGWAQMQFLENGSSGWYDPIWRSPAWNPASYPTEYNAYLGLMSRWGNNGSIPQSVFKTINNIEDAVMCWLGGFEGPANPGYYQSAVNVARDHIWGKISSDTPPEPPGPYSRKKKMPLWMYLRPY